MSNFKIGQKVVCIDPGHNSIFTKNLVKGEIYTIELIIRHFKGLGLILSEIKSFNRNTEQEVIFNHTRFRPLYHAFADIVEAYIKEQVKQEELQTI